MQNNSPTDKLRESIKKTLQGDLEDARVTELCELFTSTLQKERSRLEGLMGDQFCCMFQTVNPKDFCDKCIALRKVRELFAPVAVNDVI